MAPPLSEEAEPPPPPPGRQQKQRPPEHDDDDGGDDDGTPTASLCADLRRSLALIHEERHLVAYDLYRDVLRRVDAATTAPTRRRAPFHAFHSPLRRRRRQQQQQQGGSPAAAAAVATGDRDGSGMDRMQDYRNAKVLLERKEEEFTTLEVSGAAKYT